MTTQHPAHDSSCNSAQRTAVIFDWDGVIADSVGMYYQLYVITFAHMRRHLRINSVEGFRHWYKARWEENFTDAGMQPSEVDEALAFARAHVDYTSVPLFTEATDAVKRLARDFPLGIASTTDARLIRQRLQQAGLADIFGSVVGGEEGGSDKVRHYGEAARELGVSPTTAVAVGDTPLDVQCARHWGMRTVGVTYGWYDEVRVRAAAPDRVVGHPRELEDAVRALTARDSVCVPKCADTDTATRIG